MSLSSWIRSRFTRPATRTIRKAPRRARLSLEALEHRLVPTTFTVVNGLDDGAGSLRAAIAAANDETTNPGHDTINFAAGVTAVSLTTGQLNIASDITITGTAARVTIARDAAAAPQFRIFEVAGGALAELSGLTITGGNSPSIPGQTFPPGVFGNAGNGGGIFNGGTTTLTDCNIIGNVAGTYDSGSGIDGFGGGLFNAVTGTLTLNDCTVSGNTAVYGGGLDSHGILTLDHCAVSNNTANHGGALENYLGTTTLTDCTVSGNESTVSGGGLFLVGGQSTLTSCTVSGNKGHRGGGLWAKYGTVQLANCTVSGNTARVLSGGAVYIDDANVTFTNCTISGNSAFKGGGGVFLFGGQATLTGCTLSGNSAGISGGGVGSNARPSQTTLTNCTLFGNSAPQGGGVWMSGLSASAPASATLMNCTVSANSATNGVCGGVGLYQSGGVILGSVTLGNTIVAGNTATMSGPDVFGTIVSLGNNLIGGNPLLAPPGNYGGPLAGAPGAQQVIQTMPLLPGSPALDAGNNALLSERQDITVSGSSGTFTLTFNGKTTSAIAYNATASTVKNALTALASIGGVGGTVTVVKVGTVFQVTFAGTLANQDLPPMTAAGSGAATATVLTVMNGNNADQRGRARTVNGTVDIGAFESSGFTITVVSGSGQTVGKGMAFQDLVVMVTSNNLLEPEPVAGGLVTFTAPPTTKNNPSATLNGASTTPVTAIISATRTASVTARANSSAGSYTVTATARGITTPTSFSLTNVKN